MRPAGEHAFVAMWLCWCSVAAITREEIDATCPHHDKRLLCEPMPVDRDGPVRIGHDCWLHDEAETESA